ncbi:MAG: hypothetical protein O3C40_37290 [Planctomycetota bacterium]|nr:hypothetical protein [Planctomycetota bacterium]
MPTRNAVLSLVIACLISTSAAAQSRQAPPGMFKDLDDEILGDALLIHGKQLFIDDYVIGEMQGMTKQLHQPTKFKQNPVLKRDKPWEPSGPGYSTLIFDPHETLFKLWYENWDQKENAALLLYATSPDGIEWTKPVLNEQGTNQVRQPNVKGFQASGIFRDARDLNPARRYKMIFSSLPDGTSKSLTTSVAFSPDGIQWTAESELHSIPFSDTQSCPLWDARRQRYVAYMRFGPPNTRIISRTESEDFLHWSPKVTVLPRTKMDGPLATEFYQMSPFAYAGGWFGVIAAYHTESLKPITDDAPWTDRKNLHLAYSRNGVTWTRVGKYGAIPRNELNGDKDWKQIALDAVFVPFGEKDKEWDWGTVSPVYTPEPIIVGDEQWFYYVGINAKNWWTWFGDPPKLDPNPKEPDKGVGLATLRLDGFVSVNAGEEAGTLTTKPLVFLGDTLVVNANAEGGSLTVEALDAEGNVIEGFGAADCTPITTDSVRHVLQWKDNPDCHLLQGRPIKLRFHMKNAMLYSFEPRIHHNHYLQSYD